MMNIVKIIRLTEEKCDVLRPAGREASPDTKMQPPKFAAVRFSPELIVFQLVIIILEESV